MIYRMTKSLTISVVAVSIVAGPVVITPQPVQGAGLFDVIKRDVRKAKKKVSRDMKNPTFRKTLGVVGTVAGAGLAVHGIKEGSVGHLILGGVLLAGATQAFRQDMARQYGSDYNWAGCVGCNKKRVLAPNNRSISKRQRTEISRRTKADVKDIQSALKTLGYYKKGIDGDFGPGTRAGVKEFQASIGDPSTGALNSEQRYRLFYRAEQEGYHRKAEFNQIEQAQAMRVGDVKFVAPVVVAADLASGSQPPQTSKPAIAEYALAKSQFEKFVSEFLKSGNQSAVTAAELQTDGMIGLETSDKQHLTGAVTNIELKPHQLAEEWVRVQYVADRNSDPVILNTRDDLGSAEDAALWINRADKKLAILAKLTGAEVKAKKVEPVNEPEKKPDTVIVDAEEAPALPEDGRVEIAANDNKTDDAIPVDPLLVETGLGTMQGFDQASADEICRQSVYVSWKFPNGEHPISHYNITTPDGVIMMDNGDSTAYFTGSCVLGEYGFSYVYVDEAVRKEDWKHFKREGAFQLAQNAEQCTIDLNNPDGSAAVQCY